MELTPSPTATPVEASPSQPDSNIFSVRIVSIDYYMAPPLPGVDICYSSFHGEKVNEVPVIRVYGSTPAGQKTCLHVHQALPYLYVPCTDIPLPFTLEGDSYIAATSLAIEKALKLRGNGAAKRQHVHGCSLVRARRFYGYHASEEFFVKIYLYNPHDVSRAAKLLLAGAVFDRSLQPHESHIPYLLQFLVDYNLYGMGHLHVTKIKLRNPVPASFSRKRFNCIRQLSQENNNNSTSQQADLIGNEHLRTPVWVTSTVPVNWRWQIPGEVDSLSDQTIDRVERHSVCELEGDATVDDIVNQQFKTYLSLSQARSDVKMVQSLVPIWEEEFQRTGMHEAARTPDLGKPPAEYVLRNLSLGLELENKFMELCDYAEKVASLNPSEQGAKSMDSIQLSPEERKLINYANANLSYKCGELVQHLEEKHGSLSPLDLSHEDKSRPALAHGKESLHESFSPENNLSQMTELRKQKAEDKEALSLLKWLATSQAVEDINSDDELTREIILSPLLPSTTVDKVLEKATLDYESESQRECQDILDSVDNVTEFEDPRDMVDSNYSGPSPKKRIPQVDGSCDDLYSSHLAVSADISSELEKKNEHDKFSQQQTFHHAVKSSSSNEQVNNSSWGKLPFSPTRKEVDNSETKNFDMKDESSIGYKDQDVSSGLYTRSSVGNCLEVSAGKMASPLVHLKDNTLGGCSVRDLMRKKRHHRFEPYASYSRRVEDVSSYPESTELSKMFEEKGDDMQLGTCLGRGKEGSELCGGTDRSFQARTSITDQFASSSHLNHNSETVADAGSQGLKPAEPYCVFPLREQSWPSLLEMKNPELMNRLCRTDGEDRSNFSTKSETDVSSCKPDKFQSNMEFSTGEELLVDRLQPIVARSSGLATSLASELLFEDVRCDDSHYDEQSFRACSSSMTIENPDGRNGANETTKGLDFIHGEQVGVNAGLSDAGTKASASFDMVDKSSCLISMTFHEKPPIVDWNYEAPKNIEFANHSSLKEENHCTGPGKALDDIPPFFMGGFQEDKDRQKIQSDSLTEGESSSHQEIVMGVPTHYLNDGSYLYLLTPVISPPSVDTVNNWLSSNEGASSRKHTALMESSPLKGSSEPPVAGLQESSCENRDGAVAGPHSLLQVMRVGENVYCKKDGKVSGQAGILDSGARIDLQSEESTTGMKSHHNYSQDISQISGPDRKSGFTPLSQLGFRDPATVGAGQQLTILSVEVQAESRGDLRPDPRFDAINVLTLAAMADDDPLIEVYVLLYSRTEFYPRSHDGLSDCKVLVFPEEKQMLLHFVNIISKSDPDILVGWDIQGGSVGFLAERASYLGIGLLNLMSRTPSENKIVAGDAEPLDEGVLENVRRDSLMTDSGLVNETVIDDEWGRTHASGVHVGGRIVLNLWRVMRCEVKLNMYTLEAVTVAVLRQKIPSIEHNILTKWFASGSGRARYRCIEYLLKRTKLNLQIMAQLDLVNRTSELARVFGIDFFSVLSRGSQYRVESMFLRLAHTQNYVAISPGNHQVASQPAMECLPLVMEPVSGFYGDPVVVLDFQSLYPSMIIAYNLCFCTSLGKVSPSRETTLGVTSFSPDPRVLRDLKDQIFLAPNGAMYVPPKVCKGILPRLLEEILSTRIMVKQAMKKLVPSQQVLYRIFNARQLALKLIANVTYGYTAAGFSGRMPCAELADSIVQCGRRTLENAISYVNAQTKWNARVIYGDTDSMFVLLKGRSVKEAFRVGQEIASAISGMNPDPVALKMEKVYHPCFLLTKKRYVGYSYESPDQVDPIFDAKGIETVRRDTCVAVAKAMEQTLRLYFENQDISKVKSYLYRQWTRILSGRVPLQDFVFAKEVRLGTYSTRPSSSLPPAAIVATKAMRIDPRAEPRYGERIPYVVVHGEPGARLVDMVIDPLELLALNSPFRLNGLYYISKQIIPALQRVFGLVGADLNQWFLEMPRPTRENLGKRPLHTGNPQRTRIDYYYLSRHCVLCGELVPTSVHLCSRCSQRSGVVAAALTGKTSKMEKEMHHLAAICRHCGGGDWVLESGVKCTSLACAVFYERRKVQKELQSLSAVAAEAGCYPKCIVEWF